ncbi:Aste57867_19359 [Aphanomyces stellatus]|uniref:Aste57867_19359 protein n=1 Tax=Aphanomyces stellatus TaxID=120398 RepID=A0A485LE14_9STRA|nr:hypothetical protein As57867_019295 [Aphanomyces stellatus]VFT96073.1 Aste57867_19359 [Aphanomyces stellatus]
MKIEVKSSLLQLAVDATPHRAMASKTPLPRVRSAGRIEKPADARARSPTAPISSDSDVSPRSRARRSTMTAVNTTTNPENIMMLFDKICSDYFMARYASNDSGRHTLHASLTKLCKVINHQRVSDKMIQRIAVYCDALVAEARKKEAEMKKAAKDDIEIELALREWMKPKFLHLLEEMRLEFELNYTSGSPPEVAKEVAAMGEIRIEGWLRKKGQHVNLWRERYFMIRSSPNGTHILCYFRKKGDREPRGWYVLGPGCTVDEVRESPSLMESKKLFTFRIRHYSHKLADDASGDEGGSNGMLAAPDTPASSTAETTFNFDPKSNLKKARMKKMAVGMATAATAATAVVLTGGIAGIPMVTVGAAAFSSAALTASAGSYWTKTSTAPLALAAESLETAIWWRNCLLECIAQAEAHWRKYVQWYLAHEKEEAEAADAAAATDLDAATTPATAMLRRRRPQHPSSIGPAPRSMVKQLRWLRGLHETWTQYAQTSNLRVHVSKTTGAMKASVSIPASAARVFDMLYQMDSLFYKTNSVVRRTSVVETVDAHTDMLHWSLRPVHLWPLVAEARDVCLLRHWQRKANGTYIVWLHSATHPACPPRDRIVRADVMGGGFLVAPPVADDDDASCLVTCIMHMNPRGWLDNAAARHLAYSQSYHVALLDMLVDLRSSFHGVAFAKTATAAVFRPKDKKGMPPLMRQPSTEDTVPLLPPFEGGAVVCRHALSPKYWAEPAATNFMVRGASYLADKAKQPSERQILRLLGVELYQADDANRMGTIGLKSLGSGGRTNIPEDAFYFVVNFLLPPGYSLVLYFTPEEADFLHDRAAWAELCADFFDGEDPSFRSKRLKLIPRVVEGNWVVREGVGSTPTILGTKVTHRYFRGDHFCEVDFDIGSSTVASGLVRLLLGHAPDLVLDLGFVLEGATAEELPERLLGTARLRHLDVPSLATPFPFLKK